MGKIFKAEEEKYYVYQITNLINNKKYIGSTNNPERRWKEHVYYGEKEAGLDYPLYKAMKKYGITNFSFLVFPIVFSSRYEAEEYEFEKIVTLQTLSNQNGYNQSLNTHYGYNDTEIRKKWLEKVSQPCVKLDKDGNIIETYASYNEAARKNNMSNSATKIKNICEGKQTNLQNKYLFRRILPSGEIENIDSNNKTWHNKKAIVAINIDNPNEKQFYSSISEASKIIGVDRKRIADCISGSQRYSIVHGYIFREVNEKGEIIENSILLADKIKEYNDKNPLINGERKNITEWCKQFGISKTSFYRRKKMGMSTIEALTTKKRR